MVSLWSKRETLGAETSRSLIRIFLEAVSSPAGHTLERLCTFNMINLLRLQTGQAYS